MTSTPTPEQLRALREFADRWGRYWKTELKEQWACGIYRGEVAMRNSALLQQIRNEFGPKWLTRFKLEK